MIQLTDKQLAILLGLGVLVVGYGVYRVKTGFDNAIDSIKNAPGEFIDDLFNDEPVDVSGFKALPRTRVDSSFVPPKADKQKQLNTVSPIDSDMITIGTKQPDGSIAW